MRNILKLTMDILLAGILAASASAEVVTMTAEDKGWYDSNGLALSGS